MEHSLEKTKFTRRMFLKTSATLAAVATVSNMLRGKMESAFVNSASAVGEEVVKFGNCAQCQQGDCQIIYKMINGVVVKVEGDPGSADQQRDALRAAATQPS